MARNNKGRSGGDRPTPKTPDSRNHIGADPLAGWFSLAKSSRINRQQQARMAKGGAERKHPIVTGQCAQMPEVIRTRGKRGGPTRG